VVANSAATPRVASPAAAATNAAIDERLDVTSGMERATLRCSHHRQDERSSICITSRLCQTAGPSHSSVIRSANSEVAGSFEFSMAAS
jgi:hypothetical protein